MGNTSSRNDNFLIPPNYVPPVYPGYPFNSASPTWNPFTRSKMRKREKALREYLYTTPLMFQYPGAVSVTQPGQTLVQPGIPQVHTALPVLPINANGMATQVPVTVAAQMGGPGVLPPAPPTAGFSTASVFPQMAPMGYPAAFDYSTYLDPRGEMAPVIPRPSRRSRRHRYHRSHRRSPTPSESSASETESSGSPSSYDSYDYSRHHRHHRSGSGHNPLPRPPKDVLSSAHFRPILTQLPSAHYNSWGLGGSALMSQPQSQPQPQPVTYGNIRPRKERGGLLSSLRRRDQRFAVPSLSAAARVFTQPFAGPAMPEAHPAPPPVAASATPVPMSAVIPQTPRMQMPTPGPAPATAQAPPVIPPGTTMPMPNPAPAGSTPFVTPGGLMTPRTPRMPGTPVAPPQGQAMQMPTPMMGTSAPMPSPMAGGGGRPQSPIPMPMPAPGGAPVPTVTAMATMGMPSPSFGNGALPQPLKFNGCGEYAGLLCHSPHNVLYEDELYPTALHLFEAHKFLNDRPDLAERIRQCHLVEAVTVISGELAAFARPDWGNVALFTMDQVLYLKFRQHGDLRTLLLNTHNADLVYVESGDPFWGDGAGNGRNELGKSLMRVREQLRAEGGM